MNLKQYSYKPNIINVMFTCALQQVGNIHQFNLIYQTLNFNLNIYDSLKLFFFINRHHSSLVIRLFGCYYFKNCHCRDADLTCMLVIWNYTFVHVIEEHELQGHMITAERTGTFVFTDIWPDKILSDCSSLLFYWSSSWSVPFSSSLSMTSKVWCLLKIFQRLWTFLHWAFVEKEEKKM